MVGALAIKAIRTCEKKKAFQYIKQESNILNSESIDKFICTICDIIEHIESANITSTYAHIVIQVLIEYIINQKKPPLCDLALAQSQHPHHAQTINIKNFLFFFILN